MLNVGSGEVNWSGTEYSSPISEQEKMSTPDVSVLSASAFAKSKQKKVKIEKNTESNGVIANLRRKKCSG